MADWYYVRNDQQLGPINDAGIRNLISQGVVQPTDLVWREGMSDWLPASQVPELSSGGGHPYAVSQPPQQAAPAKQVGYYNQQASRASGGAAPPNHLAFAIFCTLCCCIPGGIVAIVYAAQVNGRYSAGDYAGAVEKSESAKKWCWISFWVGLAFGLIQFAVTFATEFSKK